VESDGPVENTNNVECPGCKQPIHKEAVKCPHCHIVILDTASSAARALIGIVMIVVMVSALGAPLGFWD
jgi:hypothetical protein